MLRMSPKNEGRGPRAEGWVSYNRAMDLELINLIADLENIQKEIVKIADFSNISKEDLMNRINILLIDEKILNKRNRNLGTQWQNTSHNKTPHNIISSNTSADNTKPIFPVTSLMTLTNWERPTSINPIPDFTIGFASPDG